MHSNVYNANARLGLRAADMRRRLFGFIINGGGSVNSRKRKAKAHNEAQRTAKTISMTRAKGLAWFAKMQAIPVTPLPIGNMNICWIDFNRKAGA